MATDPYQNDPGRWGASLLTMAEITTACLDAVEAKSIVEIGAYAGDLTSALLDWAGGQATVAAVDPTPPPLLVELSEKRPELELVRETSHEALTHIDVPDVVVIDGDHNYYTVHEELRLLDGRTSWVDGPLVLFHDVAWPHARRDTYYGPERIPDEARHPMVQDAGLMPGDPGLVRGALPMVGWTAEQEGGPRNGVLTAVEDFLDQREGFRFVRIPIFFGLGILWHREAAWGPRIEEIVAPLDGNPVLERLEMNRVHHLAYGYRLRTQIGELRLRVAEHQSLLRTLSDSRAFRIADRLSRIRGGREAVSWRDQISNLLSSGGEERVEP
ncbi:MAG: class I SAM-dependent methyltransferase [Solirubrobacterales bacterium]